MNIIETPIQRGHYQRGGNRRRAVVIHATAGTFPGDHNWLLKGGDPQRPVSVHYLITKQGAIYRYLRDEDRAWHAGISSWRIDGTVVSGLNEYSIGIELSNRNDGKDPYPPAQVNAAIALTRRLMQEYDIPIHQIVRHLDIAPQRKNDPRGLDWQGFKAALTATPILVYSEDSPLIVATQPTPDVAALVDRLVRRATMYNAYDISQEIIPVYRQVCAEAKIDWVLAVAQMAHETGSLTSFWSARPQRNPAGIGVTGWSSPLPLPGFAFNDQRNQWEQGISFASWKQSIPAHVGRLAAYALTDAEANPAQRRLIATALSVRGLPVKYRGIAPTLRGLGGTWAKDTRYGTALANTANWLVRG